MVLILGRFELSRKGAGRQDALGQAHAVMSVPVCMQQSYLPYKSVEWMLHFSLIRHQCYPGNFCGLAPPHLKLDLMSSFWKAGVKSTSCLPLFPFTAHLLGLFFVYSVVLLKLWKDCLQKKFIRLRFFINVIQGNVSHCYLKTNMKSGSFLQISEAMSMATENREGAKERRAGQHPGI